MNANTLLLALLFVLATAVAQIVMVAKVAKSKGRSAIGWGLLALLSPVITTGFLLFMRPLVTDQSPEAVLGPKPKTKPLSIIAFVVGIFVQFWAFSLLPVTDKMSDQELIAALNSSQSIGSVTLIGAGILLMIAAITNERVSVASPSDQ